MSSVGKHEVGEGTGSTRGISWRGLKGEGKKDEREGKGRRRRRREEVGAGLFSSISTPSREKNGVKVAQRVAASIRAVSGFYTTSPNLYQSPPDNAFSLVVELNSSSSQL